MIVRAPPNAPTLEPQHRILIAALVVVGFLFAGVTCAGQLDLRADAYGAAVTASRNLLRVAATRIDRTLRSCDASLKAASAALLNPAFSTVPADIQRDMLFGDPSSDPCFGPMMIADEAGHVRFQSASGNARAESVSEREDFQFHRDNPGGGAHISAPFAERIGGQLAVTISRRIDKPDGGFGGVVSGELYLSFFRSLLAESDFGDSVSLSVLLNGRIIVARLPWSEARIGADISQSLSKRPIMDGDSGTFEAVGAIDRVLRLHTFQRISSFPLKVTVGRSVDSVYAEWRTDAALVGVTSALIIATLLWLARALHVELIRRLEADRRARRTAALFEVIEANISDVLVRMSLDGKWLYISPSIERLLGYKPDEMVGVPFSSNVHPEDRWILVDALRRLREEGEEVSPSYRCIHKQGHEVFVEARLRLALDKQTGEACEIVAVARDFSWQHQVETELQRLASTDGLTGIANRRAFDNALDKEWRRARRSRDALGLLMIDADMFKKFNDQYGHLEGDNVLRMIAGCIEGSIARPGDLSARYGGEEFVALLPGTDLEGAIVVGETIRAAVQAWAISHESSRFGVVTVSIGAASANAGVDDEASALIADADAALYAAKSLGRNRVEVTHRQRAPMEAAD